MNVAHAHCRTSQGIALSAKQRGMVLLVSLILLLLATLLGLSGMRNILLQEKMSANSYDRSLAFQSTESALRAAEATIVNSANLASLAGESCMSTTLCDVIPADNAAGWTNVDSAFQINQDLLPGNAQYFIQLMSEGAPSELPEQSGSAATSQYGCIGCAAPVARSFRVTARSHAPGAGDGRALIYLQTIVRVER